jgi:hypothetical protein
MEWNKLGGIALMPEETPAHVKVTINDLYREQQETNKLLIQLVSKVDSLDGVPERITALEIEQARNAWIVKLVWVALTSSVGAVISSIWQAVSK